MQPSEQKREVIGTKPPQEIIGRRPVLLKPFPDSLQLGAYILEMDKYDPNRSYYKPGPNGKDWYRTFQNYIEVKNSNGEWKFTMSGGTVWTGSPSFVGNCIVIPLSVAGCKDRLPQSLLAEGAYALNSIFIFGKNKPIPYQTPWRLW